MAQVIISPSLELEINKKFKRESVEILQLMKSLETYPHKGKTVGNIAEFVVKEIKYKNFRFYFITDGHILKFGTEDEISRLIIKFVRMSDKKEQQKIINEIKNILKSMGFDAI